ncbi:hypothetical protein [Alkalihalobacterium alkalinitrilicum]|uniref:hypothetical protein n=1 Tax=Alkalihalobacterium alkalinitrilicum TaxID=427920 RepID=UPI001302F996|nr:hypothetical protein [Alkalihalobacterium alkalinitrilicum]
MLLLGKQIMSKGKAFYHRLMYAYNIVLYKDCLDKEMKLKLLKRVIHHEKELNV